MGLCPTTLRFFEKNRVKLLSKSFQRNDFRGIYNEVFNLMVYAITAEICDKASDCRYYIKHSYYLSFLYAAKLEMVMDRCHFKHTFFSLFIDSDLYNNREAFDKVDKAGD